MSTQAAAGDRNERDAVIYPQSNLVLNAANSGFSTAGSGFSGLTLNPSYGISTYTGQIQETQVESTLFTKLGVVMENIDWIEKGASVQMNGRTAYDYTSEAQFISEIRPQFVEQKLMIYPSNMQVTNMMMSPSGNSILTTVVVEYTIVDLESQETITVVGMGQGADATDKGIFKAQTGAFKYALRQALFIGTGQDPEATDDQGKNVLAHKEVSAPKSTPIKAAPATKDIHAELRKSFNALGNEDLKLKVSNVLDSANIKMSNLPSDLPTLRAIKSLIMTQARDINAFLEQVNQVNNTKGQ